MELNIHDVESIEFGEVYDKSSPWRTIIIKSKINGEIEISCYADDAEKLKLIV